MTVKQTTEQEGPAALTIYFAGEQASNAANLNAAKEITDKYAPAPGEAPPKDSGPRPFLNPWIVLRRRRSAG